MQDFKTFPLTVTKEWLDQVDKSKKENESKHAFIIRVVNQKIKEENNANK